MAADRVKYKTFLPYGKAPDFMTLDTSRSAAPEQADRVWQWVIREAMPESSHEELALMQMALDFSLSKKVGDGEIQIDGELSNSGAVLPFRTIQSLFEWFAWETQGTIRGSEYRLSLDWKASLAAYAANEVFQSTVTGGHESLEHVFNAYSAMTVATAKPPELSHEADMNMRRIVAQENANKSHENTKAYKAKAAARELWPEANHKGWTAEQFHTRLVGQGHTVKSDTVRKWVTKLRRTGTC